MAEEPQAHGPAPRPDAPAETQSGVDAAERSLVQALRISFNILFLFIIVLLAFFVLQGLFTVQPDEKVLVLRFGKADISRVMDEGVHYHYAYLGEELIHVSTKPRSMNVDTFWPRLTEEARKKIAEGKEAPPADFVAGAEDGYLLTGDLNVLESLWTVGFRVPKEDKQAVVTYYKAFGKTPAEQKRREEALIKALLESVVLREATQMQVFDAFLRKKTELREAVQARMVKAVEDMNCGLVVDYVTIRDIRPPKEVKDAFDSVTAAEQVRERMVKEAETAADGTLRAVAGDIGKDLFAGIVAWWDAKDKGDAEAMKAADAQMWQLLRTQDHRGGEILRILADAEAYKSEVVSRAEGDARRLTEWLKAGPEKLRVSLEFTRSETLERIMANCMEIFLVRHLASPDSELELIVNRSPEVLRAKSTYMETR